MDESLKKMLIRMLSISLGLAVAWLVVTRCDGRPKHRAGTVDTAQATLIETTINEAITRTLAARMRRLDAAIGQFEAQHGASPDRLQELVDADLLQADDILDDEGDPLPYFSRASLPKNTM